MIVVVRGAVVVQPPPSGVDRLALTVMLTGSDGSTWDLTRGPVKLMEGASGFGSPDMEMWWKTAPAVDGSAWQGSRTPQRDFVLPVAVDQPGSQSWRTVDAAFFEAIAEGECVLTVLTPTSTIRTLTCRLTGGGDIEFPFDPMLEAFASYALEFTAADPYWHTPRLTRNYGTAAPLAMFPGPPFGISSGAAQGQDTVTNPGDVPAYPKWIIDGPFTRFTVGVGESVVSGSRSAGPNGQIVIDMDPRRLTVLDEQDQRAWQYLDAFDFAPIPAGIDVPIVVNVEGAGVETNVALEFTPAYRRAW